MESYRVADMGVVHYDPVPFQLSDRRVKHGALNAVDRKRAAFLLYCVFKLYNRNGRGNAGAL